MSDKAEKKIWGMKRSTRWIVGGVLLALVLIGGFFLVRNRNRNEQLRADYDTRRVERGDLISVIGATGNIRARQSAVLTWRTSGTVENVYVSLGDQVEEGETLAVLEQTSLPQNIISAQAELVNAKQALENVRNSDLQYARALQAVEDAERALEEARDPVVIKAQAQKAVADARKALDDAERQLYYQENPADENSINKGEAELVLAENALEQAQEAFDDVKGLDKDDPDHAAAKKALSEAQTAYYLAQWNLNALKTASNDIDQAVAQGNVGLAEAQLAEALAEWDRVRDGLSPATLAIREAQLADARRELQKLQQGGGTDSDSVAAAEARVAAAQAALELAFVRAPFSGTITQTDVLIGDQVNQGTVAFRMDDLSRMFADIQVSEIDINTVNPGQNVTLNLDAILAKEYHGQVVDVALAGNVTQGVVNYKVTVTITDPDESIKPGMTAAANIVVSELEDVLLVPNRAVRLKEGKRVVYVIRAGEIETVEISLGASSETESEVIGGGLKKGDEIILNPPLDFQSRSGPPAFVED